MAVIYAGAALLLGDQVASILCPGPALGRDDRWVREWVVVTMLSGKRLRMCLTDDGIGVGMDKQAWPATVSGWAYMGYRAQAEP